MSNVERYIWLAAVFVMFVLVSINLWYGIAFMLVFGHFMPNPNRHNRR